MGFPPTALPHLELGTVEEAPSEGCIDAQEAVQPQRLCDGVLFILEGVAVVR